MTGRRDQLIRDKENTPTQSKPLNIPYIQALQEEDRLYEREPPVIDYQDK